ncbi:MAG: hypothetical protein IJA32_10725 [Lachnospiraceae bacterium]|nr:hypothetical protein [Lachnospiraceae bacterium]
MKDKKILLSKCMVIVCLIAVFFLPELVFYYIDKQELNHVKEQTAEDSNFVLSNKSSLNERLSVFGDGYDVIDTVMSEGEKENVYKVAQEEIREFLNTIGYDISFEEAYAIDITKHIYSSNTKDIYSFVAYLVEVEYADCDIDFILDMESQMILYLKLDFTDFYNMLSTESGKQWVEDYGCRYYGILLEAINDINEYGGKGMLCSMLYRYYDNFQVETAGTIMSDTTVSYSGGGKDKDLEYEWIYEYYFIDTNRELIWYNVRVTNNAIIFND